MPENVAVAVAVKVALSDDRPTGWHRADTRGEHDLRAVHEPNRRIAGRVAPGDVAASIAVEVVGIVAGSLRGSDKDPNGADVRVIFRPAHKAVLPSPESATEEPWVMDSPVSRPIEQVPTSGP